VNGRRRLLRLLLPLGAASLVALAIVGWRPALERLPGFAVERVEIRGARLVAPVEALEAMRLREGESVWQRAERWEASLEAHPLIASARVVRRLPNGLVATIVEERPVALLSDEALVAVSEEGVVLPVPPGRLPAALPLIRATSADAGTVHHLAALAVERPRLGARLLEIVQEEGDIRLRLSGDPGVEVLLPSPAEPVHLARLEVVLDDLALARNGGSAALVADLRYADQVVVRPASSR
jgi:cell division septal protein FtsQ